MKKTQIKSSLMHNGTLSGELDFQFLDEIAKLRTEEHQFKKSQFKEYPPRNINNNSQNKTKY